MNMISKLVKLIYVQLQKIVVNFLNKNTYESQFDTSKIKNNYFNNNIIIYIYDISIINEKGNKIFINYNIY